MNDENFSNIIQFAKLRSYDVSKLFKNQDISIDVSLRLEGSRENEDVMFSTRNLPLNRASSSKTSSVNINAPALHNSILTSANEICMMRFYNCTKLVRISWQCNHMQLLALAFKWFEQCEILCESFFHFRFVDLIRNIMSLWGERFRIARVGLLDVYYDYSNLLFNTNAFH